MRTKKISLSNYTKLDIKEQKECFVVKDVKADIEFTDESRTATFIITTSSYDTDNDSIDPAGIDITHFKNNPVVLWQHDRDHTPVGKCVDISRISNGWKATVEFVPADVCDFSEKIFQMVKGGYLSAVSIGFIPTEIEPNKMNGWDINKCSLFEFSIVTVPANPEALIIDNIQLEPVKNMKMIKKIKLLKLHK